MGARPLMGDQVSLQGEIVCTVSAHCGRAVNVGSEVQPCEEQCWLHDLRSSSGPCRCLEAPILAGWPDVKNVDLETIRLFLHVLAATVWVGGQITLAALVPALRAAGTDVPRRRPRRPSTASPGRRSGVLVVTGIWNVVAEGDKGPSYEHTLMLKYVLVLVSGVTAYIHAKASSRGTMALFGALTGLSAIATLFVGILLAG